MKKFKHTNAELSDAKLGSGIKPKNDPNCNCMCHRHSNVYHMVACC